METAAMEACRTSEMTFRDPFVVHLLCQCVFYDRALAASTSDGLTQRFQRPGAFLGSLGLYGLPSYPWIDADRIMPPE
jgi:hypothetical protein